MAVNLLESLVLRGVPVAGDVVAEMARMGFQLVKGQTPATLSYPRHPSQRFGQIGQPDVRRLLVGTYDKEAAATRAGRSESEAGVLVSRDPAIFAGRTVLSGWSRRFQPLRPAVQRTGSSGCLPIAVSTGLEREAQRVWPMPAQKTLPVSTRGDLGGRISNPAISPNAACR